MHVIQVKKSKKVLFIDHVPSNGLRPGKEVYTGFDEKTMEVGWTDKSYIPAYFNIDKNGKVVELSLEAAVKSGQFQLAPDQIIEKGKIVKKTLPEQVREGLLKLDDVKKSAIEYYSAMAFAKRSQLISDYKLQNTALGIYEEGVQEDYRATVMAFRDEFYRIKGLIEKAKTAEAVESVKANYPEAIISGNKPPIDEKQTERKREGKKEETENLDKMAAAPEQQQIKEVVTNKITEQVDVPQKQAVTKELGAKVETPEKKLDKQAVTKKLTEQVSAPEKKAVTKGLKAKTMAPEEKQKIKAVTKKPEKKAKELAKKNTAKRGKR